EAAELFRSIGETRWRLIALLHLVSLIDDAGDTERAQQVADEVRALAEETGDIRAASLLKLNEGWQLLNGDPDLDRLRTPAEEALAGLESIGDLFGVARALHQLACIALRSGELEDACTRLRESIGLSRSIGDTQSLAFGLRIAAATAFLRGDSGQSAILWQAHQALCATYGIDSTLEPWLDELRAATRAAASGVATSGSELDLDAAIELALKAVET